MFVAGIVGGVVVGVIAHSDHSDHYNYSEYSDADVQLNIKSKKSELEKIRSSFRTEDMTGEDKNQNSTPGDTAQQSEPILRPQIQQKHARTSQDPTQ